MPGTTWRLLCSSFLGSILKSPIRKQVNNHTDLHRSHQVSLLSISATPPNSGPRTTTLRVQAPTECRLQADICMSYRQCERRWALLSKTNTYIINMCIYLLCIDVYVCVFICKFTYLCMFVQSSIIYIYYV